MTSAVVLEQAKQEGWTDEQVVARIQAMQFEGERCDRIVREVFRRLDLSAG